MSSTSLKKLLVLTGPTASGKTGLAVELALALNTSIISADSRQCYSGIPIGTAQPSTEELKAVQHFFIGEFPVTQSQSAADFERLALGYLESIFAKSDTAIVCGGTGLYIRALCEGLDTMPSVDKRVSEAVDAEYKDKGIAWLQTALSIEDPSFAEGPEWSNPARLIRALCHVRSTGKSILSYRTGTRKQRPFQITKVALDVPREELYWRINTRVDRMIEAGLLDEVKRMQQYRECTALRTVGYAEIFDYLDGKLSFEEAVDKIKQHTRNYAKRQITWLKKEPGVMWIPADQPDIRGRILGMVKREA